MAAAIKSVAWPRSNRNRWPRCIGIRTHGSVRLGTVIGEPLYLEASRRIRMGLGCLNQMYKCILD
jgi:hypothetical protein